MGTNYLGAASGLDADVVAIIGSELRLARSADFAAHELEQWVGECHCDLPPEGESGKIECFPCAAKRIAENLRKALATRTEQPFPGATAAREAKIARIKKGRGLR